MSHVKSMVAVQNQETNGPRQEHPYFFLAYKKTNKQSSSAVLPI